MLKGFLKGIKPGPVKTDLKEYYPTLELIRAQEKKLSPLSDSDLKAFSQKFVSQTKTQNDHKSVLITAFALVCEAANRIIGMRPFDVQVIGAIAMSYGNVIEMNTGEGKTLVATMPAFLNAIVGTKVHILTFNDYLAKRDAQWMGPIYEFLGVSVGYVQGDMDRTQRRKVYENDITYLTAKQGGFDYLRSQLIRDNSELILPEVGFVIIDEVDSILIDEARVPLVIAGKVEPKDSYDLYNIARAVDNLKTESDFKTDEYQLNIYLTDEGIRNVEERLECENLYALDSEGLLVRVNQALHAHFLLHKDVDYIVRGGKIELVDEFTGRIIEDRKWPHGLQAAVEAKEKLKIQEEGLILGKTTLQHYIKKYSSVCGMTGTATPAAEEFFDMYDLPVVIVPPNRPNVRIDREDRIFPDKQSKHTALVKEIQKEHAKGRPVLVGTSSVEESETIGSLIQTVGINSQILNAKNDEEEAKIIAKAGEFGAVTISTNMAGRGTDIKLGGEEADQRGRILQLGGLYVIGTNRFESRRIDNQLRGRSGRQGDPGESAFFISLEDDLLQRHGINDLIPKRYRDKKDISVVNSQIIRREINRTQRIVEGKNLDIRRTLIKYASFVEAQRRVIYYRRQSYLDGTYESVLHLDPELEDRLVKTHGSAILERAEKQVALALIDKLWAEFLEEIDIVKQGIPLVTTAGLNPFLEFQRIMDESFSELLEKIDKGIITILSRAKITGSGIDLAGEGLKAPTSTWTYLISDNPFGDRLEIMLGGNIGFAAFAGLYWPLLAMYFLVKRILKKEKK